MAKIIRLSILPFLLIFMGCSDDDSDDPEAMPSSSNMISINLMWTPNSVDLDLSLDLQGERVSISESETPGEVLQISNDDADGTYEANIFYFTGSETVNYSFIVTSEGNELFRTTQSAPPSNGSLNTPIDVITIEKNGDQYTISE
ncbi:hypothetical protein [Ekhidna sp.]